MSSYTAEKHILLRVRFGNPDFSNERGEKPVSVGRRDPGLSRGARSRLCKSRKNRGYEDGRTCKGVEASQVSQKSRPRRWFDREKAIGLLFQILDNWRHCSARRNKQPSAHFRFSDARGCSDSRLVSLSSKSQEDLNQCEIKLFFFSLDCYSKPLQWSLVTYK